MAIKYTPELGDKLAARIAGGEPVITICKDEDMPCERVVYNWALDSEHDFFQKYRHARTIQAERMSDEILVEARKASESSNPHGSKVLIDAMKWHMSKTVPKKWGDKSDDLVKQPVVVNIDTKKDA